LQGSRVEPPLSQLLLLLLLLMLSRGLCRDNDDAALPTWCDNSGDFSDRPRNTSCRRRKLQPFLGLVQITRTELKRTEIES